MPEDLLELIIKTSSNEGDLVLDPFGGTGTTAAVAKKFKRNFTTIEISEEYCTLISKRLAGKVAEIKRNDENELKNQKILFNTTEK